MNKAQILESGLIVGKYGGTSNTNPDRVRNIADITLNSPNRRIITVSAPGNGDTNEPLQNFRVTQALRRGEFDLVWERFDRMAGDLFGKDNRYKRIKREIEQTRRKAAAAGISPYSESRGEDIQGRIVAELIGATYLDPQKYILLNSDGTVHPDTYRRIPDAIKPGRRYVMGGYSGANVTTGEVQLLPPGGTDLTGAILAKGVNAVVYENWTDVEGVLSADPRIVMDPKGIDRLTYDEMGELSHRGVNVLQVDAVEPVMEVNIPVNLRSSLNPGYPGTMVVDQRISPTGELAIGVASKEGFVSFEVAKPGMARKPGSLAQITTIFAEEGISLEQGPGGRNHVSFIAHSDQFPNGIDQHVMRRIRKEIDPTQLRLVNDLGLIAVVGQRLAEDATHVNAVMYPALSRAHLRTGAHIQSTEPNSIVFSVANKDVNRTVNVLYDALIH